jgi:hypothetical protein
MTGRQLLHSLGKFGCRRLLAGTVNYPPISELEERKGLQRASVFAVLFLLDFLQCLLRCVGGVLSRAGVYRKIRGD